MQRHIHAECECDDGISLPLQAKELQHCLSRDVVLSKWGLFTSPWPYYRATPSRLAQSATPGIRVPLNTSMPETLQHSQSASVLHKPSLHVGGLEMSHKKLVGVLSLALMALTRLPPAGLLALGSVQLYKGQRKLQEAAGVSPDAIREALPETLKHCDQMEHWYNEALRFKPDSYDACIYMAQLFAERCKAMALFAVPVVE